MRKLQDRLLFGFKLLLVLSIVLAIFIKGALDSEDRLMEEAKRKEAVREAGNDSIKIEQWIKEKKEELAVLENKVSELNSERNQLDPYIEQKEKVIKAIIAYQEETKSPWLDYFIAFLSGVISSIVATFVYSKALEKYK